MKVGYQHIVGHIKDFASLKFVMAVALIIIANPQLAVITLNNPTE